MLVHPKVREVVVMSASQVGKTEILNNTVGYYIDKDPSPILMVMPTLDLAESWSKERFMPMVRETKSLRGKIRETKTKEESNTILHKSFPGGYITVAGANSPASLASRPIRIVLCDEIDRYPPSAGAEGDPVSLAKKRTSTFFNKKILQVSTPTIKDVSPIQKAFEASDQRHYYIPCPHCQVTFVFIWENLLWTDGDPKDAHYVCPHCQDKIYDYHKPEMLQRGKWIPHGKGNIPGFHLNGLYSPWLTFCDMAVEYEQARIHPEKLKVWINTFLGLPYDETGETIDQHLLSMRKEHYRAEVPLRVLVLTAGVDVQQDRLEVEVVGWGRSEESWSITYRVIWGDPNQPDMWHQLDAFLQTKFEHETGKELSIACTAIDSGGHHTKSVYSYCRARTQKRIFAIKGVSGPGRALVGSPSQKRTGQNRRDTLLFPIGVDQGKATVYSYLKIREPGPGFCHFPQDPAYSDNYFKQLTAEKIITRYHNGFASKIWILPDGQRNEALDCRVYALAALSILNPVYDALEKRLRPHLEPKTTDEIDLLQDEATQSPWWRSQRKRSVRSNQGWVNSWRR